MCLSATPSPGQRDRRDQGSVRVPASRRAPAAGWARAVGAAHCPTRARPRRGSRAEATATTGLAPRGIPLLAEIPSWARDPHRARKRNGVPGEHDNVIGMDGKQNTVAPLEGAPDGARQREFPAAIEGDRHRIEVTHGSGFAHHSGKGPRRDAGGSVDAVVGGREAGACDVGSGGGGGDGGAAARSTFPMV